MLPLISTTAVAGPIEAWLWNGHSYSADTTLAPPSAARGGQQAYDKADTRITLKVKDQPIGDVVNYIRDLNGQLGGAQ